MLSILLSCRRGAASCRACHNAKAQLDVPRITPKRCSQRSTVDMVGGKPGLFISAGMKLQVGFPGQWYGVSVSCFSANSPARVRTKKVVGLNRAATWVDRTFELPEKYQMPIVSPVRWSFRPFRREVRFRDSRPKQHCFSPQYVSGSRRFGLRLPMLRRVLPGCRRRAFLGYACCCRRPYPQPAY